MIALQNRHEEIEKELEFCKDAVRGKDLENQLLVIKTLIDLKEKVYGAEYQKLAGKWGY